MVPCLLPNTLTANVYPILSVNTYCHVYIVIWSLFVPGIRISKSSKNIYIYIYYLIIVSFLFAVYISLVFFPTKLILLIVLLLSTFFVSSYRTLFLVLSRTYLAHCNVLLFTHWLPIWWMRLVIFNQLMTL